MTKQITNCGDWDGTDRFLWDGWRMVENRQYDFGAGQWRLFEQYVWGLQYIDELVNIALNQDVQDPNEDACERRLWVCQDANYNVTAMFGNGNRTVERYEYTPYGQRTVYSQGWLMGDCDDDGDVDTNDYFFVDFELGNTDTTGLRGDTDGNGLVNSEDYWYIDFYLGASLPDDAWYPRLHSTAGPRNPNAPQFHQLSRDKEACPFGHQGLFEDREFGGQLYVRTRNLPWMMMRWSGHDPGGYVDGLNAYEYLRGRLSVALDPSGRSHFLSTDSTGVVRVISYDDNTGSIAAEGAVGRIGYMQDTGVSTVVLNDGTVVSYEMANEWLNIWRRNNGPIDL